MREPIRRIGKLNDVVVRHYKDGNHKSWWELKKDWTVVIYYQTCRSVVVIVPKGFVTNSASVPRACRGIVCPQSVFQSSVLHDFCYTDKAGLTRAESDDVFLEAMKHLDGYPAWRRGLAYAAVRTFGKSHYHEDSLK